MNIYKFINKYIYYFIKLKNSIFIIKNVGLRKDISNLKINRLIF
jgi:hypothetical protein